MNVARFGGIQSGDCLSSCAGEWLVTTGTGIRCGQAGRQTFCVEWFLCHSCRQPNWWCDYWYQPF